MTEEQKAALRDQLYGKSIRELVNIIIAQEEEILEAKNLRARFVKIKNLVLEPEERRRQGRPRKGEKVV